MSRDIKYIGMDVHTEATVIAVRNTTGKLMMESVVETQASSILQFIHGLRAGRIIFLDIPFHRMSDIGDICAPG